MPSVYKPSIGPPTTPKIVRAACRKINFIEKEAQRLRCLILQRSLPETREGYLRENDKFSNKCGIEFFG